MRGGDGEDGSGVVSREARGDDVISISHDLRNPMTMIALDLDLLEEHLPHHPELRRALSRLESNVAFVQRLIDDLLDLSQFDAERVSLDLEPTDLTLLADGVLERAVAPSERPRVTLVASPSVVVMADAARIERVLANLLVNALKYTAAHSAIHIVVEAHPSYARVSVSDEGPGISPEHATMVFQKFKRAPTSHGRDGYGLGLYVSRKIIEAHGGRIGLDSRPGDGSQFFFELPRMLPSMTAW